jgi:phytoene desaturase
MKKAVIIGSGVAGLATSVRLAHAGFDVTVVEAADGPGGKLRERWYDGYRFDLGPSLFTLPENVNELFRLCGENPEDHFHYVRLDTLCHYFWDDGTRFHAPADPEALIRRLVDEFGEEESKVRAYLRKSAFTYERTAPVFLHQSLHRLRWLSRGVLRGIASLPWLPLTGTLNGVNASTFRNPKTAQYFNRYATYNGSDPYQAPAMMMLIPHLEQGIGAYLPDKGMGSISQSIYELALRKGVTFMFNERAEQILLDNDQVKGVRTALRTIASDVVVSNADMHPTYRSLLGNDRVPEKLLAQEKSSSALIFYWGVRKSFPELDVHNIFFSKDYKAEFDAIFRTRTLHPDPTVYVHITSGKIPEDAPPGCENWFVMINVPHESGQDWEELRAQARRAILDKLSRALGVDVASLIAVEDYLDPVRIETRTSSYLGALYGNASNSPYAAFLRHANESTRHRGLYFCGGSVHPGGGIPLCLFGAKITADLIVRRYL